MAGREMFDEVIKAIQERDQTQSTLQRFRLMAATNLAVLGLLDQLHKHMEELAPADFLDRYERARIVDLPRHLRALRIRAERAYVSPEKDRLKSKQLSPHIERYDELRQEAAASKDAEFRHFVDGFRCMLEEYNISLFSPEIKTRVRVSSKRLEQEWQRGVSLKTMRNVECGTGNE